MSLHDMIQADAVSVFANTDDFAESATYYADGAGSGRSISIIVDRQPLGTMPPDGDNDTPVFEIQVANDSTVGITSDELREGVDQISFAVRVGVDATRRTITKLLGHDEGMLILECR